LLRRAAPDLLRRNLVTVQYLGELRALPPRAVSPWNRTWLKDGATLLARAGSGERVGPAPAPGRVPVPETQTEPLAARWAAGEGTASAVAFANPTAQELAAFVRLASRAPRDPRLRVTWDAGARLCVAVDAVDGGRYLNGLELSLHLADAARPDAPAQAQAIPQTAPGRYELALDAPRGPALATVRLAGAAGAAPGAVDRAAVAGRYEPEFESVGNDRAALRELAARTGGAVVEPGDARPLDLPRPRREVPLAAPLAAAGAACVAAGLVWWRRS